MNLGRSGPLQARARKGMEVVARLSRHTVRTRIATPTATAEPSA